MCVYPIWPTRYIRSPGRCVKADLTTTKTACRACMAEEMAQYQHLITIYIRTYTSIRI